MVSVVEARDVLVVLDGVLALPPVSFSLDRGRCLVVTGSNGTGKTTLLRVLAGLQRPTAGAACVLGSRCDERDHVFRRELAAQIGPPPMARDLTVEEQLLLVARTWAGQPDKAAARVAAIIQELGLEHLVSRFPHQLSSGQAQLVALALTLSRPSSVLVLDEPEHRLDADRVDVVIEALRARLAAGTTVVLATHEPRIASELADEGLRLAAAA